MPSTSTTSGASAENYTFTKPDQAKVDGAFEKYKDGESSTIAQDKTKDALGEVGCSCDRSGFDQIVKAINETGALTAAEFYRLCYILQNYDGSSEQYSRVVFMLADTNCSGEISQAEAEAFIDKMGIQFDKDSFATAL